MNPTTTYQEEDFIDTAFDIKKENEFLNAFQKNVSEAGSDWMEYYRKRGRSQIYLLGSSLAWHSPTSSSGYNRVYSDKASSPQGVLFFKNPLEIEITKTEDVIVAWSDEFQVSGDGATVEEALDDLYAFLIHIFFTYLHADRSKMSKQASNHLNRFIELLSKYEEFPKKRD